MFTIEVKKRGKDEEFGFKGLKIKKVSHEDCYNEKVKIKRGYLLVDLFSFPKSPEDYIWHLKCTRCGEERKIPFPQWVRADLVKLVIDGGEMKLMDDVRVVVV